MSVAKGFRLSDDSTAKLDWNYVTKPDGTKSIIEEVNDVKQDLSSQTVCLANEIIRTPQIKNNSYVDTDGSFQSYNGWHRTEKVYCGDGVKVKINTNTIAITGKYCHFYDSNLDPIANTQFSLTADYVDIPTGAEYVAYSCDSSYTLGDVTVLSYTDTIKQIEDSIENNSNILSYGLNVGRYYDDGYKYGTNRLYKVMFVQGGEKLHFVFSDSDFRIYLYMWHRDNTTNYVTVTSSSNLNVLLDTDVYKVAFTIYPTTEGGQKTLSEMLSFDIGCYILPPVQMKICSWNVGLWNNGSDRYFADDDYDETAQKWRKMIASENADIMLMQESTQYIDESQSITPYNSIFANNYRYYYTDNVLAGKMMVSKSKMSSLEKIPFTADNTRNYVKGYIYYGGRKIAVIDAHTSFEDDFDTSRKAQFQELITVMQGEEYAILCGDFNAFSTDEFDLFTNASMNIANHGYFGDFATWPHERESWPNPCIDNIITTSNIKILYVYTNQDTGNNGFSDHRALFADVVFN